MLFLLLLLLLPLLLLFLLLLLLLVLLLPSPCYQDAEDSNIDLLTFAMTTTLIILFYTHNCYSAK